MPQLGEFATSKDLGLEGKNKSRKYIWSACVDCGKERWVRYIKGQALSPRCPKCSSQVYGRSHIGDKGSNWKGGRYQKCTGYVYVWLSRDDFYAPMLNRTGKMLEHRLVMARHLGRCLQLWEHVHHKNGIKNDNRIENLELTVGLNHSKDHSRGYRDGYTKGLADGKTKQIQLLKKCISGLEAEVARLHG